MQITKKIGPQQRHLYMPTTMHGTPIEVQRASEIDGPSPLTAMAVLVEPSPPRKVGAWHRGAPELRARTGPLSDFLES